VLVEVFADPGQLLLYIGLQGRGDFDIFAKRFDAHRVSPLIGSANEPLRRARRRVKRF
jgi:hypothetical protein